MSGLAMMYTGAAITGISLLALLIINLIYSKQKKKLTKLINEEYDY